jgi:hypothetical protein
MSTPYKCDPLTLPTSPAPIALRSNTHVAIHTRQLQIPGCRRTQPCSDGKPHPRLATTRPQKSVRSHMPVSWAATTPQTWQHHEALLALQRSARQADHGLTDVARRLRRGPAVSPTGRSWTGGSCRSTSPCAGAQPDSPIMDWRILPVDFMYSLLRRCRPTSSCSFCCARRTTILLVVCS